MPVTKDEILNGLTRPMVDALEGEGITKELLAKKLMEELEAAKQDSYRAKVVRRVWNEKTKRFEDAIGTTVIYSEPLPEWDVRQKARMDAHKLRGDYPPEEKRLAGAEGAPLIPGDARPIKIEFVKSSKEEKK